MPQKDGVVKNIRATRTYICYNRLVKHVGLRTGVLCVTLIKTKGRKFLWQNGFTDLKKAQPI